MINQQYTYENRAQTLRTRKQQQIKKDQDEKIHALKQGLTKDEYWKKHVKSASDVIQFYNIYYPEYPQELCEAIARRIENLIQKSNDKDVQLEESEVKLIRKYDKKTGQEIEEKQSIKWDPLEDINQQKLEGKIKLTERRLEQLMNE